jgi:hypothetical protein
MRTQEWTVTINLDEDVDTTHARAVLRSTNGVTVHADGTARRNPADAPIPEIGEELAAARALEHLAERLGGIAEKDIRDLTHPVGS